MIGVDIVLIVILSLGFIVLVIRYNSGDPFAYCGRRREQVYAEQ
jgi:hypothetical protein